MKHHGGPANTNQMLQCKTKENQCKANENQWKLNEQCYEKRKVPWKSDRKPLNNSGTLFKNK